MPFEVINHVKINKKTGKPLSPATARVYKTILNQLAAIGVDTKQKLLDEYEYVIYNIEEAFDTVESESKDMKRKYYCAIFYALDQEPLEKQKPYYDMFCKSKEYAEEE
jgi:hypothetical protein